MGRPFRTRRQEPVRMMLALVGADGQEPSLQTWRAGLRRAGVPFTVVALQDRRQRTSFLCAIAEGGYQGLIVADGEILDRARESTAGEILRAAERRFGTRRLIAYASPSAANGLRPAGTAGPLDGVTAKLTDSGHRRFPYLRGEVAMDGGSWAQPALPQRGQRFEALLTDPGGNALLGIHRLPDGREHMVQTFAANADQSQAQLLRPGQIRWLTRGMHLGCERVYLSLHVDDVLLANHAWDPARHVTDDSPAAARRMTAADASRAADWARSRGLRLDLIVNGHGSDRHTAATGGRSDALLDVLRAEGDVFGWVNHTYSHLDLAAAAAAAIEEQLALNIGWAQAAGIDLEPGALVTGAHSGLGDLSTTPPRPVNRELVAAVDAHGIRFVGCDASRSYPTSETGGRARAGRPFRVGGALAVPRYPLTLPYDAVTADEALDQLRHHGGSNDPSWESVVMWESARVLSRALGNDPRPHYCHQSNLIAAGGGTLLTGLLDAVWKRYHEAVAANTPIVQPTLSESGRILERDALWREATEGGSVRAFTDGSQVRIESRADGEVPVPLTGTTVGEPYAGTHSGWLPVAPGTSFVPGGTGARGRPRR